MSRQLKLQWHPEAEEEFGQAGLYYEEQSEGQGVRFATSEDAAIQIIALMHGARRPGYWKDRLS